MLIGIIAAIMMLVLIVSILAGIIKVVAPILIGIVAMVFLGRFPVFGPIIAGVIVGILAGNIFKSTVTGFACGFLGGFIFVFLGFGDFKSAFTAMSVIDNSSSIVLRAELNGIKFGVLGCIGSYIGGIIRAKRRKQKNLFNLDKFHI